MTLALLLRYWREAAIGALVLALVASCVARDHRIASTAIAQERSRQADSVLRVVTPQLLHTDTVLAHDTVVVRRAIDRVVTLRDTVLQHLTDTVLVKQFVTRADSAAKACTDLLNTCALYRQEASATIAALRAKVNAAPIAQPKHCTESTVLSGALGIAGGFLLGRHR